MAALLPVLLWLVASTACNGTLLPNGIFFSGPKRVAAPPINATLPVYLSSPPAVINISLGRQLFVDTFLLNSTGSARIQYHQASYTSDDNSLIPYDQPWDSWPLAKGPQPAQCDVGHALVTSRPYSGGLWRMADGGLRLYYLCPGRNESTRAACPWCALRKQSWTGGLCL